ncbi:MAG: hypothetical protein V5B32_01640 [Candidatus Accumulibacter sp. UW26]|jgi:hypothetical protein
MPTMKGRSSLLATGSSFSAGFEAAGSFLVYERLFLGSSALAMLIASCPMGIGPSTTTDQNLLIDLCGDSMFLATPAHWPRHQS